MGEGITAAAMYAGHSLNGPSERANAPRPRTQEDSAPMSAASSHTVGKRVPVSQGKQRIPGLYSYLAADGTLSYPWSRRVDGKMRRGVLETTGRVGQERKTEAVNEYHGLFTDVRRGDIELGDRNVTIAALAASYLEREEGVLGTLAVRTLELHRQRLNDHVIPALGANTKAADVRVQQLRKMIDTLKTKKTHDGSGGSPDRRSGDASPQRRRCSATASATSAASRATRSVTSIVATSRRGSGGA